MTLDLQDILRQQAEVLSDAIRSTPDTGPGEDQRTSWGRAAELAASIGAEVSADGFLVGSCAPAARTQELGTHQVPPRPFLAQAAAAAAPSIAIALGHAAAALIQAELRRR